MFEGTYKLGGRSSIMTNVWRKTMNISATTSLMTKTQVTVDGCIPVSYSQYGKVEGGKIFNNSISIHVVLQPNYYTTNR